MKLAVVIDRLDDNLIQSLPQNVIREFRIDLEPNLLSYVKENASTFRFNYILTLRSEREGGKHSASIPRGEILTQFIEIKPDYIDLEVETDLKYLDLLANKNNIIPILSKHDYSDTMVVTSSNFVDKFGHLSSVEAVIKFIGRPNDSYDMLKSLEILRESFSRYIFLGVGEHGLMSRTMGDHLNQEIVFSSIEGTEIPSYDFLSNLNNASLFLGLLGKDLSHSLSSKIHHLLMRECGLSGFYHHFEVHKEKNLEEWLQLVSKTIIRGINVTFPYKNKVPLLLKPKDNLESHHEPVNTLVFDQPLKMLNTDISGFSLFFDNYFVEENIEEIVIFGAGGAAKAIVKAIMNKSFKIVVVNRSLDRFNTWEDSLLSRISYQKLEDFIEEDHHPSVYIHATPLGYDGSLVTDIFPLPNSIRFVIDLNYGVKSTPLLVYAISKGIKATDGKVMLLNQAIDAFEAWTNCIIDRKVIHRKFLEVIQ